MTDVGNDIFSIEVDRWSNYHTLADLYGFDRLEGLSENEKLLALYDYGRERLGAVNRNWSANPVYEERDMSRLHGCLPGVQEAITERESARIAASGAKG